MDNQNNNNDYMSIFSGEHVDVDKIENNTKENIEQTPSISISVGQRQDIINDNPQVNSNETFNDVNSNIVNNQPNVSENSNLNPQSIIDDDKPKFNPLGDSTTQEISSTSNIESDDEIPKFNPLGNQEVTEENHQENNMEVPKTNKSFVIVGIIIAIISIGLIVILVSGTLFDNNKPPKAKKDPKKIEELVENSEKFHQLLGMNAFSKDINVGFSCTSDSKDSDWYNSPGTASTVDCTQFMSEFIDSLGNYNQENVTITQPDYGTVVFSNGRVTNGTKLVYGDYTCTYNESNTYTCE